MTDRKFKRTDKEKYSLSEKEELGKLCVKYKEEYDKKVEENKNAVFVFVVYLKKKSSFIIKIDFLKIDILEPPPPQLLSF